MNRIKKSLVAFCGLFLLVYMIAAATARPTQGQGGDPGGPTKPVKVVNTASEPVPVTGSVTGNVNVTNAPAVAAQQSGIWNVSIAGTPTVKIDPQGNTVRVGGTELILGQTVPLGPGEAKRLGPFDVSRFSKVKIKARSFPAGKVRLFVIDESGFGLRLDEFEFDSVGNSGLYELPGTQLSIELINTEAAPVFVELIGLGH